MAPCSRRAIARSSIPSRCSSAASSSAARSRTVRRRVSRRRARRRQPPRADLVATAIEVLRVAALSSYENRAISSGVLLLEGDGDPGGRGSRDDEAYQLHAGADRHQKLLPPVRRAQDAVPRQPPGRRARHRRDARYARGGGARRCRVRGRTALTRWRRRQPQHLRRAQSVARNQGVRQGVQIFSFRNARWHLLDVQAKYEMWESAVGNPALAERLFQTAFDLADARQGALFVVLRDPRRRCRSWSPRRSARRGRSTTGDAPMRRSCCTCCAAGRQPRSTPRCWPAWPGPMARRSWTRPAGSSQSARSCCTPSHPSRTRTLAVEGARTTAAMAAGRFGAVLKVSEDGLITSTTPGADLGYLNRGARSRADPASSSRSASSRLTRLYAHIRNRGTGYIGRRCSRRLPARASRRCAGAEQRKGGAGAGARRHPGPRRPPQAGDLRRCGGGGRRRDPRGRRVPARGRRR